MANREGARDWNGRSRDLGRRTRIVCLGDDLVLTGFDEDEGRDKDDQYRYDEADDDGPNGRISYPLLGRGIAWCGLLVVHGWLDAEGTVWVRSAGLIR
jgi:hypothetical protein